MKTKINETKQETYLFIADNNDEKLAMRDSGLCFIRDWRMGWFEVPNSMLDEYFKKFNGPGTKHSVCSLNITKEKIKDWNLYNWPEAYQLTI